MLAAAGLVCAASLAALAAVVAGGGPAWLIATLAFAGGASVPATPTAVRALCAALVADEQLRLTAYAMLAMLGAVLGDLAAVALGMAVFGAAEAVTGITLTALVQHVAPPGARTEPYAIIISAALAGIAVGNLAGGALAGGVSVRPVFMAAAGGAVVATTWAALRKHKSLSRLHFGIREHSTAPAAALTGHSSCAGHPSRRHDHATAEKSAEDLA